MQFSTPNVCEPLIDLVIDNYRLLEVVGQGGMGCVYKARDEKMGRIVALKLLRNNLGAFTLREGKALGQLNHSNIVNVFYMGESKEGVFIIMEFVDGSTLHEYMSKSVQEIIPIMKQSLLALEHAHNSGVIHRDIKPSNIMVSKAGTVKVMDFGLAKVETPDQDRTVTRLQAGTISYMSPEQVRGLQHVSQLSDIYSIGKTFYHILARRLPFEASESDQYSILKAIIERQFKPPSHYNKDVPRGLDKIIMKAIEKDPSQRYKSAREMYKALVDFESKASPKPGMGYSIPHPSPSFLSRFPVTKAHLAIGVAMLLVFLSITAFASWYTNRETVPTLAEQTRNTIQVENPQDPESSVPINPPPEGQQEKTNIPAANALVSIDSNPANSTITLGEARFQSPIVDRTMNAGRYQLTVEADGYDTYSNTVAIESDTTLSIELLPQGRLIVESSVPGSVVTVNGNRIGRTPINEPMPRGAYMIVVSANGHSTYSTQVRIQSGNDARVLAALQMQGMLEVEATPGSDIFIDNSKRRLPNNSDVLKTTLAPGSYALRVSHPEYGTWEKSIRVSEGDQRISIDFTQQVQVNIGANVFGASIYIDGVETKQETPAQLRVGVGVRRIEVRKEGYTADPPYIDQLIEEGESSPLQFAFQLTKEE